ncbi:putative quinol monooxygenase [Streptomyces sp. WELS2]|uniref:putative quinol monooxygenase n=1 Tax=Streptomyces sp. WELS2 TaxID=2749435 RepID=UPI0015F08728|nr:putative quinol monooxygenase [Streptomyces sp. WELS2]
MTIPIAVLGFASARPEKSAELQDALLALADRARREPGCIDYRVHRASDDKDMLVFYEVWRSQEDLDVHLALPYVADFMAERMTYLRCDIDHRVLEVCEGVSAEEDR